MRIAVMAAGAVGGYFGGRMAAAGHNVAFIARGTHRDAIRQALKIESALGGLPSQRCQRDRRCCTGWTSRPGVIRCKTEGIQRRQANRLVRC